MRILWRMGAFAIAIAFVLAISLLASSDDPTDGTWLLDVGASKFNPGPGPQSQARIYKADGKTIKMIASPLTLRESNSHRIRRSVSQRRHLKKSIRNV